MKNGQFFELQDNGSNKDYTIYHWTRVYSKDEDTKKVDFPFFVVLEPEEITFYQYTEKDNIIIKNQLLSIPYNSAFETSQRVTKDLIEFFNPEDLDVLKLNNNNYSFAFPFNTERYLYNESENEKKEVRDYNNTDYLRTFFLDFLWDLKINKCFKYSKNYYQLINLVENTPIIYGVFLKLYYSEFAKIKINEKEKLEENSWLQNHQKNAKEFWLNFLTKPENETFFVKTKKKPYLKTLDEEIESVFKIKTKSDVNSDKKIVNFLLKRYDYFKVLKYLIFNKTFYFLSKGIFLAILFSVFIDIFNVYSINKINTFFTNLSCTIISLFYIPIIIIILFVVVPILISVYNTLFEKKHKDFVYYFKILIPQMFLPRLIIAISSGWLVFYTSNEMFGLFDETNNKFPWLLVGTSLLVLIAFMYNEMTGLRKSSKGGVLFTRILSIIGISFLISYSIGIFTAQYTIIEKFMHNENNDKYILEEWKKMDYLNNNSSFVINSSSDTLPSIKSINIKITESKNNIESLKFLADFMANIENPYTLKDINKIKLKFNIIEQAAYQLNYKNLSIIDTIIIKGKLNRIKGIKPLKTLIDEHITNIRTINTSGVNKLKYIKEKSNINRSIINLINLENLKFNNSYKDKHKTISRIKKDMSILNSITKFKIRIPFLKTYEINIPLKIIFRRAILAMFIGIFLQLIIQDKSITEPV